MLYLLRSFGEGGISILKVGYAGDYKFRLAQYQSHNPYIKEISQREGELVDETLLHYYLHSLGLGECKDEWYKDCPEVIDVFNKPMEEIKKEVWKNRDDIFKFSLSRPGSYFTIYRELLDTFGIEEEKDIDKKFNSLGRRGKELEQKEKLDSIKEEDLTEVDKTLKEFLSIPFFNNRLKYLYSLDMPKEFAEELFTHILDPDYAKYYWTISPSRAGTLGYQKGNLEAEYNSCRNSDGKVLEEIYKTFQVGSKYSKSVIKSELQKIYDNCGQIKTAKANDLEKYFDIKTCQITNKEAGKRDMAFEILKKKEG